MFKFIKEQKLKHTASTLVLVLLFTWPLITASNAEDNNTVIEPTGYHGEPYRSPVPSTLQGATVLNDGEAYALWQGNDALFIDVLPRAPKPKGLPEDTLWLDAIRESIKGSYWLPNTGYEQLAVGEHEYFKNSLAELAQLGMQQPLVFFCQAECWMSWNAAKRALNLGYENIYWYPEGTDGWLSEAYPAEEVLPYELESSKP